MSKINWPVYNKALIHRGNITIWFSPDVAKSWYFHSRHYKRGATPTYTEAAIEVILMLRYRFRLTLRETQGFAESLLKLMGLDLQVPDYTTLSRRAARVAVELSAVGSSSKPLHVVIDSTGLKVYGEGEWKVRLHGSSKRRTWRKLHLAIDESTNQIISAVLSENSFKDSEVFEDLMAPIDIEIEQVTGDGAYDCKNCYKWTDQSQIKGVFPPRRGAKIKRHGNCREKPLTRDQYVRDIRKLGRKKWKKKVNYHRRSIAETGMYRFKTILGDKLQSRLFENQATEAFIKCKILNQMPTPAVLVN